jgi:hypothetical protein
LRYSCAADSDADHAHSSWIQQWEVSEYLSEILVSYRLLFGQNKVSRELFDKIKPLKSNDFIPDPYLIDLCHSKHPPTHIVDKDAYLLVSSFQFLRTRLGRLKDYLDNMKPKTWREMWRDRRNSPEWWTFWTVLTVGSLGLTLSTISTIATVLALWRQW